MRLGSACYKEGSLGLILELAPDKQAAHGLSLAPGGKTSANFKHTPFKRTLYGGFGGITQLSIMGTVGVCDRVCVFVGGALKYSKSV